LVAPGAVALGLPFMATGAALYAPVIAPGAVTLGLSFLTDADILFGPFVARVAIPPVDRITLVAALGRAARVEGLPRNLALSASARIILIK
jgi:hypothetical protein